MENELEYLLDSVTIRAHAQMWIEEAEQYGYPDSVAETGRKILDRTATLDEIHNALDTIDMVLDRMYPEENN